MELILHGSGTTTSAVRRAIQERITLLSRVRFGSARASGHKGWLPANVGRSLKPNGTRADLAGCGMAADGRCG